jgi:hypothetical protein
VVKQIEGLEHHTHLLTDFIDVAFFIGNTFITNEDTARSRSFKHIDTTDKG